MPMPERKSGRTLLLGLATGVLIVAAGAWLLRPGESAAPAALRRRCLGTPHRHLHRPPRRFLRHRPLPPLRRR